jgi:membrane protein YqaA with SNARE-associated domain
MSKTEDKLKSTIKEYLADRQAEYEAGHADRATGIFLWGFVIGALFSYMSILPLTIGVVIGVLVVKKNPLMINAAIDRAANYMSMKYLAVHKKLE